jgi:signal transduction histidine kinase/ligand-binding sensor domain-containing protein
MKIRFGLYFLLIFIYLQTFLLLAQTRRIAPTPKFERISVENGLSQVRTYSIIQDKSGFLWIATEDGLNRYDGYSTKVFKHLDNDSTTISSHFVYALTEDKFGNIWAGTKMKGLNKYNPSTEKFIRYKSSTNNHNTLIDNRITSLEASRDGGLWVGTEVGLSKIDATHQKITNFSVEYIPIKINNFFITSILETSQGDLWVGTQESGLFRWEENSNTFLHFSQLSPSPIDDNITTLFEDSKGTIWIGTRDAGFYVYEENNVEVKNYKRDANQKNSLNHNFVTAFAEDDEGKIWIATFGGGLDMFSPKEEHFTHHRFTHQTNLISSNFLLTLLFDQNKILWVGTDVKGICKLDKNSLHFQHFQNNPFDENSPADSQIWTLIEGENGDVWLGTDKGLDRFDRLNNRYEHFKFINKNSLKDSLSETQLYNKIRAIYEENEQNLWIGSENGLILFDKNGKKFIDCYLNTKSVDKINSNRIRRVLKENADTLWVATLNSLYLFNKKTKSFSQNFRGIDFSKYQFTFWDIHLDKKGNLWFGTDNGLLKLNKKTLEVTHYQHEEGKVKNQLSFNAVHNIFEDENGIFWLTVYGGGVNKFDPSSQEFTAYRQIDGWLPTDGCACALKDDLGKLWVSTVNGFVSINPETKDVVEYDERNGLQGKVFPVRGCFKNKHGEMFFGGANGFNIFYPADIKKNAIMSPLAFTDFKVFDKPLIPSDKGELKVPINFANEVVLDHKNNVFSIEYVSLDFGQKDKTHYAYILEGFDKDWREVGNQRVAHYTNLAGGEYIFKVKAARAGGVWSKEVKTIKIVILPPFWELWWFRLILSLMVITIVYFVYKFRINSIKRQNKKLEKIVNLRTQEVEKQKKEIIESNEKLAKQKEELEIQSENIAQQNNALEIINQELKQLNEEKNSLIGVVAHDLRSPLNQLKGMLTILQYTLNSPTDEQKKIIESSNESIERLRNMISRILDINTIETKKIDIKFEKCDLHELLEKVIEGMKVTAEKKQIQLHLEHLEHAIFAKADINYLRQVFENLISNAIKFSPREKNVWIKIQSDFRCAKVCVKDEGQGINEEDQKKLFGKFQKLSARPTAGEESTGLGLSIAKKYIEAMHGSIGCESQLGNGATFYVELECWVA